MGGDGVRRDPNATSYPASSWAASAPGHVMSIHHYSHLQTASDFHSKLAPSRPLQHCEQVGSLAIPTKLAPAILFQLHLHKMVGWLCEAVHTHMQCTCHLRYTRDISLMECPVPMALYPLEGLAHYSGPLNLLVQASPQLCTGRMH